MKSKLLLGLGLSTVCLIGLAVGQQESATVDQTTEAAPDLPPPPPPPCHGLNPVMGALDADKDGIISAEELAGAATALATLDADGDGALSRDELRPPRPQGEPPKGMGDRKPGDQIMRLDADASGGVSFEEFTVPVKQIFTKIDTSADGQIDADEAAAAPPPRGPHGPGGPGGPPHGHRGPGMGKGPQKDGSSDATAPKARRGQRG